MSGTKCTAGRRSISRRTSSTKSPAGCKTACFSVGTIRCSPTSACATIGRGVDSLPTLSRRCFFEMPSFFWNTFPCDRRPTDPKPLGRPGCSSTERGTSDNGVNGPQGRAAGSGAAHYVTVTGVASSDGGIGGSAASAGRSGHRVEGCDGGVPIVRNPGITCRPARLVFQNSRESASAHAETPPADGKIRLPGASLGAGACWLADGS